MRGLKKFRLPVVVIALLIATGGCKTSGEGGGEQTDRPRVLVFGVDGGTWDVIEEMFGAGELPNLKALYDRGIHGVLRSRPPVLSPVVWTTIFTGRPHEEHGVLNWKTSQSTHRKVRALWELTSAAELTTHVFNVPSTWPTIPVNGVMLAGFPLSGSTVGGNTGHVVDREGVAGRGLPVCYTASRAAIEGAMDELEVGQWSDWVDVEFKGRPNWQGITKIKRLGDDSFYLAPCYRVDEGLTISHPGDLREKIASKLGDHYIPEGPGWSRWAEEETPSYLYDHLVEVSRIQTRAAEIFARTDWDLFIYVDTLVDRVSHPYWAYMRPADYVGLDAAKAARYSEAVRNSYRETDRQLGDVMGAAKGEFYVVIVSDHGFHSSRDNTKHIGTHEYDGIYLVAGPGLKMTTGDQAFIEDVCPTLLYLLDLPVAEDMQGKVIGEVGGQLGRPIESIASYEDGSKAGSEIPVDAKTWEQLRGLGYVDGAPPRKRKD